MSASMNVVSVMRHQATRLDIAADRLPEQRDELRAAAQRLRDAGVAVAELIELGQKVAAHDYTFMSGTQWADMQAFRDALAAAGGAK